MRWILLSLLAPTVTLLTGENCWAQAGRYVPIRAPTGGGGGFHFLPFMGDGNWDLVWTIVLVILAAIYVGWKVGYALGRGTRGSPPGTGPGLSSSGPPAEAPPSPDLIVSAEQVAEKAEQTTGLLKALAREDRLVDPSEPRTFVTATFREVQRCWQERDYGPVERFLMPSLLADHQKLLRAMRSNGEINRIEDLQVRRLEFVHLVCPDEIDGREVTALITFEAKVYFVAERTGAFLRGAQQARLYQEFWTFRQQENAWRLQAIERSHVSNRLRWPNRVEGQRFEPA